MVHPSVEKGSLAKNSQLVKKAFHFLQHHPARRFLLLR